MEMIPWRGCLMSRVCWMIRIGGNTVKMSQKKRLFVLCFVFGVRFAYGMFEGGFLEDEAFQELFEEGVGIPGGDSTTLMEMFAQSGMPAFFNGEILERVRPASPVVPAQVIPAQRQRAASEGLMRDDFDDPFGPLPKAEPSKRWSAPPLLQPSLLEFVREQQVPIYAPQVKSEPFVKPEPVDDPLDDLFEDEGGDDFVDERSPFERCLIFEGGTRRENRYRCDICRREFNYERFRNHYYWCKKKCPDCEFRGNTAEGYRRHVLDFEHGDWETRKDKYRDDRIDKQLYRCQHCQCAIRGWRRYMRHDRSRRQEGFCPPAITAPIRRKRPRRD